MMRANKNCFIYYFINRIADAWNSIQDCCFNTILILGVKHRISKLTVLSKFVSDQLLVVYIFLAVTHFINVFFILCMYISTKLSIIIIIVVVDLLK